MTLCVFGCKDSEGNPREATGRYGMCTVCAANIAAWSRRRRQEQQAYDDHLRLRRARLAEVREPNKASYVTHLIVVRKKRRAAHHH